MVPAEYNGVYVRSNVFREPLPDKDGDKDDPEKFDTFLLEEDALAAMHRIIELDAG